MNNSTFSLEEKAKSLINLIESYRFWTSHNNKNFDSFFSKELLDFLFLNKQLIKKIIYSDTTSFLKYQIKLYKEYRNKFFMDCKYPPIEIYKKKRFQKYEENREHYINKFYKIINKIIRFY